MNNAESFALDYTPFEDNTWHHEECQLELEALKNQIFMQPISKKSTAITM